MAMIFRNYNPSLDYQAISAFLVATHSENGSFHNWLQPRWEYMHFHPLIKSTDLTKAIILENDNNILGIIHPEHGMDTAYIQIDPSVSSQRYQLLMQAEKALFHTTGRTLSIFVNSNDKELEAFALQLGYTKDESEDYPLLELETVSSFSLPPLPLGFRIKCLQDDNDLAKISRVIHRGFNHSGEPPSDHVDEIRFMQFAPNFRKDLTIAIESPESTFASYCGIWFDNINHFSYIEPVATDPSYRRMGLGKIAVLEAINRCSKLGAKKAFVGSGQDFYRNMGFKEKYHEFRWTKKC